MIPTREMLWDVLFGTSDMSGLYEIISRGTTTDEFMHRTIHIIEKLRSGIPLEEIEDGQYVTITKVSNQPGEIYELVVSFPESESELSFSYIMATPTLH